MTSTPHSPVADWLVRRSTLVLGAAGLLTAVLAIPFLTMAPDGAASQEPGGEIFEARDLALERFASDVFGSFYVLEARDGDLLRKEPLVELHRNAEALRDDPEVGAKLFRYFDAEAGVEIEGMRTLADEVDGRLAEDGLGGLEQASPEEVSAAATALIDEVGPVAANLSPQSERVDGRWVVPGLSVAVLADNAALGGGGFAATLDNDDTTKEEFSRDVLALLRGDEQAYRAWGVAIDATLTSQEQGQAAGPFIGATVFVVLLVVGLVLRSYWAVAVVGAGVGASILWLSGITNLLGLEEDQILATIVPIALISFGVDFAFHAIGRYREVRVAGQAPRRAIVLGLSGVAGALLLALTSDVAAFLSNATSGIQSIVQFGIAASVGLVSAFVLLGVVTPIALARIEEHVGAPRGKPRRRALGAVGAVAAAATTTAAVLLAVFVLPPVGVGLLAAYVPLFVLIPAWVAGRRRVTDAASPSEDAPARVAVTDGGTGLGPVLGRLVAGVGRSPVIVLGIAAVVTAVCATAAVRVPTEFDVDDFFAADTDFVVGLDKLDQHVGEQGGEPAVVYIEAELTDPVAVAAVRRFVDEVRALDSELLARDAAGAVDVVGGAPRVLDAVLAQPAALGAIEARTGSAVADDDRDGVPDEPAQLAALWSTTNEIGVPLDTERLALPPSDVQEAIWLDERGEAAATQLQIGLVGSREASNVNAAVELLDPPAERLEASLVAAGDADARVVLTGGPVTRVASLDAVRRALLVSLPISLVLCWLVSLAFLRSARLAGAAIVPILLVVTWLYAFMTWAGYALNLVTATIGAISIGIGIDFAIHLVARYREELRRTGARDAALSATGEGTGVALVASAVSSVAGFVVLAFAPMPLFASYGLLTAVMITMALVATLVVLPPLLRLTTRDRAAAGGALAGQSPTTTATPDRRRSAVGA